MSQVLLLGNLISTLAASLMDRQVDRQTYRWVDGHQQIAFIYSNYPMGKMRKLMPKEALSRT